MDTKVYENFSVVWTMEELQLSDRDKYENGQPDSFVELPEDDGTYQKNGGYSDREDSGASYGKDQQSNPSESPDSEGVSDAGLSLYVMVNDEDAQYMEEIHSGDQIEIYWKQN